MNSRLGKEAMGRLVLEASTGMHGAVAKQIALELTAVLEAQQAGGEPVAWRVRCIHPLRDWVLVYRDPETEACFSNMEIQSLYTHPAPVQQEDALTDAQIDACWDGPTPSGSGKSRYDIARAIIRAALAAQPAAERVPFDPLAEFGFMLEQRRDVWVVVDDCGGTTPASLTERVMWDAIVKSRGITATSGKESGNG